MKNRKGILGGVQPVKNQHKWTGRMESSKIIYDLKFFLCIYTVWNSMVTKNAYHWHSLEQHEKDA